MTIQRMDHVGVVVEDLDAAIEFFVRLGLEPGGRWSAEGRPVDRIIGLDGVRTDAAFVGTPDGHGRLELIEFHSPPGEAGAPRAPANTPGIRHLAFVVEDLDALVAGLELVGEVVRYDGSFKLCYVRGPAGIIVELAEKLS